MVELEELYLKVQDLVLIEFVWTIFQTQCWYDVSKINISVKNKHVVLKYNLVVMKDADCIVKYPYAHWKQNHCLNSKADHHNLEEKAAVNAFDE